MSASERVAAAHQKSIGVLVPLVVACPAFLQSIATSSLSVALPSIAKSLDVSALQLDLVITSYVLSIALFLPASAWLADRFGAKRMFCLSIAIFCAGSALCGLATSAGTLVAFRIVQGFGAALMIPVGRTILLQSVPSSELVSAMVWYTVPPVVGRLAGPLVGGLIVSVVAWQGIFLINLPLGAAAILLALIFLKGDSAPRAVPRFDLAGFLLLALGLASLLAAGEVLGKNYGRASFALAGAVVGLVALAAYVRRSLRQDHPIIDLRILRAKAFRTNIVGAAPFRIAIAGMPFLLPLLFQLGFGLSPLTSGLFAASAALGSLSTRAVLKPALKHLNLKGMLIGSSLITAAVYASYALFTAATSHALIFAIMFIGGLTSSLCMVALNTLGFADIPADRTSHAASLLAMAQQLLAGIGVVIAAALLGAFTRARGGSTMRLDQVDFAWSFLVIASIILISTAFFVRLDTERAASPEGSEDA